VNLLLVVLQHRLTCHIHRFHFNAAFGRAIGALLLQMHCKEMRRRNAVSLEDYLRVSGKVVTLHHI
jgi:hypothetical protein